MMSTSEWVYFFEDWAVKLLPELTEKVARYRNAPSFWHWPYIELAADLVKEGCSILPSATELQIMELEKRMKCTLPPSYKAFLQASNGWFIAGSSGLTYFFDTDNVGLFSDKYPDLYHVLIENYDDIADEDYFDYTPDQGPTLRERYLPGALAVSTYSEFGYFITPHVISSEGEWEAWDLSMKHPGAYRYPSFEHLMIALKEESLDEW